MSEHRGRRGLAVLVLTLWAGLGGVAIGTPIGDRLAEAQRWPLYTHLALGRARTLALARTCP